MGIIFPVSAATSYSHIAKGERQCVDRRVDLPEELLPVVLVHLLEVHACQNCEEDRGTESASETSCDGAIDFVEGGGGDSLSHGPRRNAKAPQRPSPTHRSRREASKQKLVSYKR